MSQIVTDFTALAVIAVAFAWALAWSGDDPYADDPHAHDHHVDLTPPPDPFVFDYDKERE